jgi:hypothetical protein
MTCARTALRPIIALASQPNPSSSGEVDNENVRYRAGETREPDSRNVSPEAPVGRARGCKHSV